MKITKYDHSCLVVEEGGRHLAIDPVEFATKVPILDSVDVVIVTHKHSDHLTPTVLDGLLSANPQAEVLTIEDNAEVRHTKIVKGGDELKISNFRLKFFGEDHAPVVADDVPCANVGVVVNDVLVHPGDSYDTPPIDKPKVLCPAVSGPWLKTYETMQYISKVRPEIVLPVHDEFASPAGKKVNGGWLQKACEEVGAKYRVLEPGQSLEVSSYPTDAKLKAESPKEEEE
jgi:L-ascorbate metabolism protein UlaG (beta-lactamase superfamily)